jgi:hypothetical protein
MSCHAPLELPQIEKPLASIRETIAGLDLSRQERLLVERSKISPQDAGKWTALFRKTLGLIATYSGQRLWIHEEADEVLHLYALDVEEYPAWCQKVFGKFLSHKLRLSTDEPIEPVQQTIDRTAKFWKELYGEDFYLQGTVEF